MFNRYFAIEFSIHFDQSACLRRQGNLVQFQCFFWDCSSKAKSVLKVVFLFFEIMLKAAEKLFVNLRGTRNNFFPEDIIVVSTKV